MTLRVCRPTNLCSGRTPFSVRNFKKAQFLFFFLLFFCFFTFSTVNIKQVQVVCHIVIKEKKHSNKQAIIKPRLKTVAFMVILCANIFQCVCFQRTIKVKTSPCLLNLKPIYQISIWLLMMYICMFCRNYVYTIQISKIQFCFAAHLQVK